MRTRLYSAIAVSAAVLALGISARAQVPDDPGQTYLPLVAQLPTPTATSAPPTPAGPPFVGDCTSRPRRSDAPNFPVGIAILNKFTEVVTFQNFSDQVIDLTGWKLCSLNGGQQHIIPPGTTMGPRGGATIPASSAPVWNDRERDDGALYDPSGRLVAYYFDGGQFSPGTP